MTPGEAEKLLRQTSLALQGKGLPFDGMLEWEQHGAEAWALSRDASGMVWLLGATLLPLGVAASCRLARAALPHIRDERDRARAHALILATEAWAASPTESHKEPLRRLLDELPPDYRFPDHDAKMAAIATAEAAVYNAPYSCTQAADFVGRVAGYATISPAQILRSPFLVDEDPPPYAPPFVAPTLLDLVESEDRRGR